MTFGIEIMIIELIGIIAFAISGAIVGIKKSFDIFGIIVLGVITAVGGGALRDIILGILHQQCLEILFMSLWLS